MSPRLSQYTHYPKIPTLADEVSAAMQIQNATVRQARLNAIQAKHQRFQTAKPVAAAVIGDANLPMSDEEFATKKADLERQIPNPVLRLKPLNELKSQRDISRCGAETKATLEEENRLKSNPHFAERYRMWRIKNKDEIQAAYAELSSVGNLRLFHP